MLTEPEYERTNRWGKDTDHIYSDSWEMWYKWLVTEGWGQLVPAKKMVMAFYLKYLSTIATSKKKKALQYSKVHIYVSTQSSQSVGYTHVSYLLQLAEKEGHLSRKK